MRDAEPVFSWTYRIADALVLWPERARERRLRLADDTEAGAVSTKALRERLSAMHPVLPDEDVSAAVESFDRHTRGDFLSWMATLADQLELGPQRETTGGVTPTRRWYAWLAASGRYDVDSLLCFNLARRGVTPRDYDFYAWGAVCPLWSHEVEGVLRRGVADMHVHLGGARHPNLSWLHLVTEATEPEAVRALLNHRDRDFILDVALDPRGRSFVNKALRLRLQGENPERCAPALLFAEERRALIETWGAALEETADDERVSDLDRYLNAKSAFLAMIAQPSYGGAAGLQRFRKHFDAARTHAPAGRAVNRFRKDLGDVLSLAALDANLKRIELRTAPLASIAAYGQTLAALTSEPSDPVTLSASTSAPRAAVTARFCVHFMRSMNRFSGAPPHEAWRAFHVGLTRAAVTLHAYRLAVAQADPARLEELPRIDIAGQERDNPPENFAFIVRLLRQERGPGDAWEQLRDHTADGEIYGPWRAFLDHEHPRRLPRLRASCHAGEDYFHPLDGLAAIDAALSGLILADGDSLGHALALGAFEADGTPIRGPQCFATTGRQFDVLLWLHKIGLEEDAPREELSRIDEALSNLGNAIALERPPEGWAGLHGLLETQRGPLLSRAGATDRATHAFRAQHAIAEVARERARPREVSAVFDALPETGLRARSAVAREISERGVLIEINPSSNLRISGSDSILRAGAPLRMGDIRRWPLINLIRDFRAQLRFTINTDDPGIFGSSISSEYALLFECLLADRWPRMEAIDFLERCRIAGVEGIP